MKLLHTTDPSQNIVPKGSDVADQPPAEVDEKIKEKGVGIGKLKKGNKVKLPNLVVSGNHCVFHKDGVIDSSKSGTFILGRGEPEK